MRCSEARRGHAEGTAHASKNDMQQDGCKQRVSRQASKHCIETSRARQPLRFDTDDATVSHGNLPTRSVGNFGRAGEVEMEMGAIRVRMHDACHVVSVSRVQLIARTPCGNERKRKERPMNPPQRPNVREEAEMENCRHTGLLGMVAMLVASVIDISFALVGVRVWGMSHGGISLSLRGVFEASASNELAGPKEIRGDAEGGRRLSPRIGTETGAIDSRPGGA